MKRIKFTYLIAAALSASMLFSVASCGANAVSGTTVNAQVSSVSDSSSDKELSNYNDSEHVIEVNGETAEYSGISVTKKLSPECDREVLRGLGMMPQWKPGIQNDEPCRTKVCIPIVFKL
jgi:hypothetical protein